MDEIYPPRGFVSCDDQPQEELFTDGGVIGRNPSKLGGTWAWCLVQGELRVKQAAGVITPEDMEMERITNNLTELFAAVRGLEATPEGWRGVLWTDSQVTQFRLLGSNRFNGIPNFLRKRVEETMIRRVVEVRLCAGHPTKKELQEGRRLRNGLSVSRHNKFVDRLCNKLAQEYKRGKP